MIIPLFMPPLFQTYFYPGTADHTRIKMDITRPEWQNRVSAIPANAGVRYDNGILRLHEQNRLMIAILYSFPDRIQDLIPLSRIQRPVEITEEVEGPFRETRHLTDLAFQGFG